MDPGHNCTNYVAYVESTVNGAPTPSYSLGNAATWYGAAHAHGVTTDGTAANGAVAWWSGGSGHVAYVESVNPGGSITVSEDAFSSGPFDWRTIDPGSGSWPNGFIHFKDLPAGSGNPNYEPFAGDFNDDGIGDIGLRNVTNGNFFIKHGPTFNDQLVYTWAPGTNYQPFVGDFNGDGYADIGLRNITTGVFFIKHGPGFNDQTTYSWAPGSNYQPFAGDFNDDGIGDIGLRNVTNGNFFIKHGPAFNDQLVYTWAAG
jgi:surface antigen